MQTYQYAHAGIHSIIHLCMNYLMALTSDRLDAEEAPATGKPPACPAPSAAAAAACVLPCPSWLLKLAVSRARPCALLPAAMLGSTRCSSTQKRSHSW